MQSYFHMRIKVYEAMSNSLNIQYQYLHSDKLTPREIIEDQFQISFPLNQALDMIGLFPRGKKNHHWLELYCILNPFKEEGRDYKKTLSTLFGRKVTNQTDKSKYECYLEFFFNKLQSLPPPAFITFLISS